MIMKHYAGEGAIAKEPALTGCHGLAGSALEDVGLPPEDVKLTALCFYKI